MTRKVSLWVVIALVGALAATTMAVVVLATDDDGRARTATGPAGGEAWHQAWAEGHEGPAAPMMGDIDGTWGRHHDAPLLPWLLFALSAGTAVGLLVAWSPWRHTPAPVAAGPGSGGTDASTTAADVATATAAAVVTEAAASRVATSSESATQDVSPEAEDTVGMPADTGSGEAAADNADAVADDAQTADAEPTDATADTSGEALSDD